MIQNAIIYTRVTIEASDYIVEKALYVIYIVFWDLFLVLMAGSISRQTFRSLHLAL